MLHTNRHPADPLDYYHRNGNVSHHIFSFMSHRQRTCFIHVVLRDSRHRGALQARTKTRPDRCRSAKGTTGDMTSVSTHVLTGGQQKRIVRRPKSQRWSCVYRRDTLFGTKGGKAVRSPAENHLTGQAQRDERSSNSLLFLKAACCTGWRE